jgi:uncharacterized surface protein with fasciclin (FAS1) repeats
MRRFVSQQIDSAIERGVPLFNSGHHQATYALYLQAVDAIVYSAALQSTTDPRMLSVRQRLEGAKLSAAPALLTDSQKAWQLRYGFDDVRAMLASASHAVATLSPIGSKNVFELAVAEPDLSTYVSAVQAADLARTLSQPGLFTVFAPTNAAFAAVPKATLDSLLDAKNIKELQSVCKYHVIAGSIREADYKLDSQMMWDSQTVKTLSGQEVRIIKKRDGSVYVNDAEVVTVNGGWRIGSNGVVHIIDKVMSPSATATPVKEASVNQPAMFSHAVRRNCSCSIVQILALAFVVCSTTSQLQALLGF